MRLSADTRYVWLGCGLAVLLLDALGALAAARGAGRLPRPWSRSA
jgi:hypothetical protein